MSAITVDPIPGLPPDLKHAYECACHQLQWACALVHTLARPLSDKKGVFLSGSLVVKLWGTIRRGAGPARSALNPVRMELATEGAVRFGSIVASSSVEAVHNYALLALSTLERAADMPQWCKLVPDTTSPSRPSRQTMRWVEQQYRSAQAAFAAAKWPDGKEIMVAMQSSISRAATGRAPSPPAKLDRPILTLEDKTILTVLRNANRALKYAEIVHDADALYRVRGYSTSGLAMLSETKLKDRVPFLIDHGFVARPSTANGQKTARKGIGITDAGRSVLADDPTANSTLNTR